jgi:hypothetical protein
VPIRVALAGLLVAGGLSGCSGGSDDVSPYCRDLRATSDRLSTAQQDLYKGGARGEAALNRILGELRSLEKKAPTEIRTSLSKLAAAFQQAAQAVQHPTTEASEQLAAAATALSTNGKKVTDYVARECK